MKGIRMSKHIFGGISTLKKTNRCLQLCSSAVLLCTRKQHCQASSEPVSRQPPITVSATRVMHQDLLHDKFDWLGERVPCFGVNGNNITVLQEPCDFYETFRNMVRNARKRIVIASLYLGTGDLERKLVHGIEDACERSVQAGNEHFEVHVLLDYTRGSRGANRSSRTMLLPLLRKYKDRVHVYLYHTPDLRGLLKRFLPERFNEVVGLNHMKIYLADDDFIISGANLSDSYFTNRQDRYIQFRQCCDMSDYLCDLISAVSQFSFHLQCNNSTVYPSGAPHPYSGTSSKREFKDFANSAMTKLNNVWKNTTATSFPTSKVSDTDTWLYPLIQMGPFNIQDDELATQQIFTDTSVGDRIYLASGYFNLTSQYVNFVINESCADFRILTASPETNGFFGAHGISGYIPTAYTYITKQFYEQTCARCQQHRLSVYEYYKHHWTFHVKGLWYYLTDHDLPVMTLIGSPNFGYRSIHRDLECQVAVLTTNTSLQQQLRQEHERLYDTTTKVTAETFQKTDRYVPLWVRFATRFVKNFF